MIPDSLHKAGALLLFLFLFSVPVLAQDQVIDSLKVELKKLDHASPGISTDTSRINIYYALAEAYYRETDQASEQLYTGKGLNLVDSLLESGDFNKEIKNWLLHQQGTGLGNKGNYFSDIGDLPKALDYYFRALKLDESIGHLSGMERHLCNIAIVYDDLGDHKKSLNYYFRALKYAKAIDAKSSEADLYGNIATAYMDLNDNKRALSYCARSLKMFEELKDTSGIAFVFGNIGLIYKGIGQDQRDAGKAPSEIPEFFAAVTYFKRTLALVGEDGDKSTRAINVGSLGSVYMSMQKYDEAERYLLQSLQLSREINDLYGVMSTSEHLSDLYAEMAAQKGIPLQQKTVYLERSYNRLQDHNNAKDSIFNQDKASDITRKEMNYEYEKKEAIAKATAAAEKRTQHIIIGSVIGGLLLSLIFLVFIFRSLRITRKQNIMIELQKQEVEEHRKGIIDSITYARRIQEALLKEEENITAHLPEHFVLYKPKDIVSGDFYWSIEKRGYWYICVADCTGHGVPGAFMSMLGIAYLNEITSSEELLTPGEILNRLREKIVKELKQTGASGESQDGMDISMMRYSIQTGEMTWAGANNALWISSQEEGIKVMKVVEPDKQPIGYTINPVPFRDHIIDLQKNDTVYLFSDGYADQFGGPKGKKFKSKNLQEKLISLSAQPMNKQKDELDATFEAWRGNLEQLDDVAIIGIRNP
ncbi:MAG: protein serine/threonine phosphatase [Bacteroidetes bacterium]|nr:protein serine/threonine phosphatase [Bacteroidota bacterium]